MSQYTRTQQCILRHHFHRLILSPQLAALQEPVQFYECCVSSHHCACVIHEIGGPTSAGDAALWEVLLEGSPRCGRVSRELTGLREFDLLGLSKRQTGGDLVTSDVSSQGDTSAVTLSWKESNRVSGQKALIWSSASLVEPCDPPHRALGSGQEHLCI